MGRWQQLRIQPKVVCDTGHNIGGWQYLAPQIQAQTCKTLRIVFGMVDDKDMEGVMRLLPKEAVYYWTQASSKRAFPVEIVAKEAERHALRGKSYSSVREAYDNALEDSLQDDFIFVGGSSYIVADLLAYI